MMPRQDAWRALAIAHQLVVEHLPFQSHYCYFILFAR